MTRPILRHLSGACAAITLTAALGGCGPQSASDQQMTATSLPQLPATLPLAAGPALGWPTAPAADALPAARPLRTVRVANPNDSYGYADAAYDYQNVLGDAPPDYYFNYGDIDPWAWEGYDQSVVFVEPIDDGYRYYYYRPGADRPYFVRDPYYGYGYDGDSLAAVYDGFGGVVPYADYGPRIDYASRYFDRGRDLFAASRRADRRAVAAADWAARSQAITASRTRWVDALDGQPQWRDLRARTAARDATYWRQESVRREADARRFADWKAQDFRTPPPPRAIPAAWTGARWANDRDRFLPARAERGPATAGPAAHEERADRRGPQAGPMAAPRNDPRADMAGQRGGRDPGPMRADRSPAAPKAARAERPQGNRGGPQGRAAPERGRAEPSARAEAPRPQRDNPGRGNRGPDMNRAPAARAEPARAEPHAAAPQPQPQRERGGGGAPAYRGGEPRGGGGAQANRGGPNGGGAQVDRGKPGGGGPGGGGGDRGKPGGGKPGG